ncbi:MAG TPA: flippase [Bryobacterales bacterium]|nr:flippase [Bryobacterales bacterium]
MRLLANRHLGPAKGAPPADQTRPEAAIHPKSAYPAHGPLALTAAAAKRVAGNALVLAALKGISPLISMLLLMVICRRLGAEGMGRYALAYAYLNVFILLGSLGLPTLLTREGARHSHSLSALLASAMALTGALSLALTALMTALAVLSDFDVQTVRAMIVLSLAIAPSICLSCYEAAFLSREETLPIALAALAENVFKAGLGIAAVLTGCGIDAVLAAAVAGRVAACGLSFVLLRRRGILVTWTANVGSARKLAAQTPVFALSSVCATLYWRADIFLLSRLRPLSEVGCYAAAYRILDMAILPPQSLCQALYPRIARDSQTAATGRNPALLGLALVTIPLAAAVTCLAPALPRLLYGRAFWTAAPTLMILIWTTVPYAWNRYHANVLLAHDSQRADLLINVTLLALNIALNLILIPRYGANGAAAVTLASAILYGAAQARYLKSRTRAGNRPRKSERNPPFATAFFGPRMGEGIIRHRRSPKQFASGPEPAG